MAPKRPTQADVARLAGVSRATVSYVLNAQTDQRIPISPETRSRVLSVIADLGYQVNAQAQSLRSGDSRTIGVLLPIYENPHYWHILLGIATEAETAGYSLLLSHSTLTPEQQNESIKALAEQRVDGMIMVVAFKGLPDAIMQQLRSSTAPIVEISGSDSEFDYVHQGYSQGATALMDLLLQYGHRRIGFIHGVANQEQGTDRLDAYRAALRRAGLPIDDALIRLCDPGLEDGYQAARHLLSLPDRPTALIAINDLIGIAALRAAADMGLQVPRDVSVAAFDDIPFARYTVPRLTSVSTYPEESGQEAVRLLLRRLQHPDEPRQVVVSPWQLNVRESVGPAPGAAEGGPFPL